MPVAVPMALGWGVSRMWLDFDGMGDDGNCLRTIVYDPSANYANANSGTLKQNSIGTGFIVLDSSRTNFTPIQSVVGGTSGDILSRMGVGRAPIWARKPLPSTIDAPKVRNGESRLNGNIVNNEDGFSGCPEVLAFRPTSNVTASFYGDYNETEGMVTSGSGLLMGETLLYSSKLPDEQTQRIEGYLMRKWLGLMPDSCVDVREATISGNGTIEVDDVAGMPKIDPGFEGRVNVASGAFEVTIDPQTGAVIGALDVPSADVSLPANCTLTVKFTSRVGNANFGSEWTVFDCAALVSAVDWTLNFEGAVRPPKVEFVRVGSAIKVRVNNVGMTVILR